MPSSHPDSDITFVYVKELSDSIRSVSGVLQGLVNELHQHAITLHKVKGEVDNIKKSVEKLDSLVVEGSLHRPGALTRLDELERDLKDIKKSNENDRRDRDEDGKARKGFRYAIYVAIITAALGLLDRVARWISSPGHQQAPAGKAKP